MQVDVKQYPETVVLNNNHLFPGKIHLITQTDLAKATSTSSSSSSPSVVSSEEPKKRQRLPSETQNVAKAQDKKEEAPLPSALVKLKDDVAQVQSSSGKRQTTIKFMDEEYPALDLGTQSKL